jgi:hypothetical protein
MKLGAFKEIVADYKDGGERYKAKGWQMLDKGPTVYFSKETKVTRTDLFYHKHDNTVGYQYRYNEQINEKGRFSL